MVCRTRRIHREYVDAVDDISRWVARKWPELRPLRTLVFARPVYDMDPDQLTLF